MKRNRKRVEPNVPRRRRVRYFPVLYCVKEEIAIGVSKIHLKRRMMSNGEVKIVEGVDASQWSITKASFRPEYYIDFMQFNVGDKIHCPVCGSEVDCRAFPSSTVPKLTEVMKAHEEYKKNKAE